MRYRVENADLVITGSLMDYGLVTWTKFDKKIYETRWALDEKVKEEWERRGKPEDLTWVECFEAEERAKLEFEVK